MFESRIPRVFAATEAPLPFDSEDEAWLVRHLDLGALVRLAESRHPFLAVDLDSVEGLNADTAGVRFAVKHLGVDAVLSRRPQVALHAAELGCVGLVHVFAFDSTGLRRSFEAIPEDASVGLVVSPGIVLPYVEATQRRQLRRPLVAYGLIETPEQVRRLLGMSDAVVLAPELATSVRPDLAVHGRDATA